MPVRVIEDPIDDPRWAELLDRHPRASVFHSPAWLRALRQTYGYEPFVVTTSPPGEGLENGLAVCRVKTWLSRRLVSLPFSDHCDPLADRAEDLSEILWHLSAEVKRGACRSVELRPRGSPTGRGFSPGDLAPFRAGAAYALHTLDLHPEPADIFRRFHPSSTQRAIRRAEREGLTYEAGSSEALLGSFYRLLRMTRRRHGLPPQPIAWFRNLVAGFGNRIAIHVAAKDGRPVATILTLTFGKTLVYKYGGSDGSVHHLGGMPFLFWRAIRGAKDAGLEAFDLGRSDLDQPGLIAFKEHLGGVRSDLTYYAHPERRAVGTSSGLASRAARRVVPHMPDLALDLAGRFLYKHLG